MVASLEKLSKNDLGKYAFKIATEKYPVGSLIRYFSIYTSVFGKVDSISKKGFITVKCGKLPLVKVTNSSPVQGIFWYKLEGFLEDHEFEDEMNPKKRVFKPYFIKKRKRSGRAYTDITWKIKNLKPGRKNLVSVTEHFI